MPADLVSWANLGMKPILAAARTRNFRQSRFTSASRVAAGSWLSDCQEEIGSPLPEGESFLAAHAVTANIAPCRILAHLPDQKRKRGWTQRPCKSCGEVFSVRLVAHACGTWSTRRAPVDPQCVRSSFSPGVAFFSEKNPSFARRDPGIWTGSPGARQAVAAHGKRALAPSGDSTDPCSIDPRLKDPGVSNVNP